MVDDGKKLVLFLARNYRYFLLAILLTLFAWMLSLKPPEGLSYAGLKSLAIFFLCLSLWVSQLLPLSITSLLAIILIPTLGVLSSKETYSLFGNEAVFFILGVFILAAVIMKSGLSTRIALIFLNKFGSSPGNLLIGIMLIGAFLSFWMSEHAVAAMLFPIVLEIAHSLKLEGSSRYGKALFLSMAWGVIIGGVGTFLGGARNPLAIGILKESTGKSIEFFEWIVSIMPVVFVMLIFAAFLLRKMFKPDILSIDVAKEIIQDKVNNFGKLSIQEIIIGAIMVLTVFSWIVFGKKIGLANIALISVVILFALKLVKWSDVERYVNWGVILMYGGAIALGFTLERTGAAHWFASSVINSLTTNPLLVVVIFTFISIFLTEGISNAAVVAILMPVGISISTNIGLDPKIITYAIAMPSGLAFCLPMSTPANAIAYSSGFLKVKDVIVPGLILNFASLAVFTFFIIFYWPIIGIRVM